MAAATVGVALTLAACGAGTDGSSPGAAAGGATVSARAVGGVGTALTGPDGKTLYFAEQEVNGTIVCQKACLSFWMPLTVSAGTTPTAGPGVSGTLASLNRPDGMIQVTLDGKPLYSFVEDGRPGRPRATDSRTHSTAPSLSGAPRRCRARRRLVSHPRASPTPGTATDRRRRAARNPSGACPRMSSNRQVDPLELQEGP
jgi:predicted lipoprotein with Yx(FWY)xxD motif